MGALQKASFRTKNLKSDKIRVNYNRGEKEFTSLL